MASGKQWAKRLGATPGRLVVVGVLAVLLIALIVAPPGGSAWLNNRPSSTSRGPSSADSEREREAASVTAPAEISPRTDRPWPVMELNEIVQYDPFVEPWRSNTEEEYPISLVDPDGLDDDESLDDPQEDRIESTIAAIREQGVRLIVLADGERVALVGERMVRVGDVIDGLVVTAIETDGVVLSRIH